MDFIGVDQWQGEAIPNVAGLIFPEDQAGFLAGALAASMSKTGIIAEVLGTDLVPPVVAFGEGFVNGAKHVNPGIEVIKTYHPGGLDVAFTDPEWGATTARQALDQGADVVFRTEEEQLVVDDCHCTRVARRFFLVSPKGFLRVEIERRAAGAATAHAA